MKERIRELAIAEKIIREADKDIPVQVFIPSQATRILYNGIKAVSIYEEDLYKSDRNHIYKVGAPIENFHFISEEIFRPALKSAGYPTIPITISRNELDHLGENILEHKHWNRFFSEIEGYNTKHFYYESFILVDDAFRLQSSLDNLNLRNRFMSLYIG